MHRVKHKKPAYFDFDLIVIGTGAGGGVAAHAARRAGKRVAVIEADSVGGECPNYGCVPTKALLQATETLSAIKDGERFGVKAKDVKIDYAAMKKWKERAVADTGTKEGEAFYRAQGIKVIRGYAHFLSPWTVSIGARRYTAKNFLVATGTSQFVPPVPGLKEHGFITYREALELNNVPETLFIIGGGAIGSEFAHFFGSLGCKVHVADMAPRLIAPEDAEVGELIGALFEARGITVHTGVKVTRITKQGHDKVVHFERNGTTHQVRAAEILVATGKIPNTDLGLENAGVAYDRQGIKVNRFMRTTSKHIYAAGDVVGPYQFTHTASYQSRIAAHNMFHRHESKLTQADYHAVPRCIFVDPEVACVGMTEQQLKDKRIAYQVAAVPIAVIGRSNTSGQTNGFVKILAGKYGTILGASIVSPRAGEMIHELTLAVNYHMTARQIAETIHAFPTWSEAIRKACQQIKSR